jgi:hypothetical protein
MKNIKILLLITIISWGFCLNIFAQCSVIASHDTSICFTGQAQLNCAPTGTGPFSFSWTPITGLNNPNIQNPTATPSSTITYTVHLTDNSNSCTADDFGFGHDCGCLLFKDWFHSANYSFFLNIRQ